LNAAILAALAGLLGLGIGRLWDARSEAVRWRRDQRIRIYEGLVGAYYQVREAIRVLALSEPGTTARQDAEMRVYQVAADAWNRQVVATWLQGSTEVIAAVEDFDRVVVALFHDARTRCYTWHEFQDARRPTLEALRSYIEAVRRELRLPGLNVTLEYPGFYAALADRNSTDESSG